MLLQTWLLIFGAGAIVTGLTITQRLPAVIGALFGIALLTVAAFGALNIEIATSCCIYQRDANQPLAFLGLAGVVVNLVFLFADATGQIPDGGPTSGEEMSR
jgi:hypothetical protein